MMWLTAIVHANMRGDLTDDSPQFVLKWFRTVLTMVEDQMTFAANNATPFFCYVPLAALLFFRRALQSTRPAISQDVISALDNVLLNYVPAWILVEPRVPVPLQFPEYVYIGDFNSLKSTMYGMFFTSKLNGQPILAVSPAPSIPVGQPISFSTMCS